MSACAAVEDACGVTVGEPIRAAAAALLRRVDREPRAARVHAARARLPRLRERDRHGERPPRDRRARFAHQEGGQRDHQAHRRPRGAPDQRAPGRLLAGPRARELRGSPTSSRRRASSRWTPFAGRRARLPGARGGLRVRRPLPPDDYPLERGRLASSRGLDIAPHEYEQHFVEEQVPHSNALHSRLRERGSYLVGPLARYALNSSKLSPLAREAAADAGLPEVCRNPFQSIVVRAVEILYALDEALRIIDGYEEPDGPASRCRRAPLPASAGPRRRAGCSGTATRSTIRGRSSTRDRAAHLAEPARDRAGPARARAAQPGLDRRAAAPALRAGDPQLRPLHLVRHPLPLARGGSRLTPRGRGRGQRVARDDGAGLAVARGLRGRLPARIRWSSRRASRRPARGVVGRRRGDRYRRRRLGRRAARSTVWTPSRGTAAQLFRGSTHAFSVAEAVELARAVERLPPSPSIYGIEGRDYAAGSALQPQVEQAVRELVIELGDRLGERL